MKNPEVISRDTTAELITLVAEWLTEKALSKQGKFSLCLAGGSTPKALYTLLAQEPFASKFPWQRTHIFFGDERFVPHSHPDSNYRMASEALLNHVLIPAENIHSIPYANTPEESAQQYAATLQSFYGVQSFTPSQPVFDVTLLGLGEDGHTASLFPGTAMLEERIKWVSSVTGAKPEPRISLTYPTLENSNTVAFLVTGANKQDITNKVLNQRDQQFPATRLCPLYEYKWFIVP